MAAIKAPPERRRQAKLPAPQPENVLRELRPAEEKTMISA